LAAYPNLSRQNRYFAFLSGMTKKLIADLFKTFFISIILSFAVNIIYYLIARHPNYDFKHVVPSLVVGGLLMNSILLIMSFPVLFLSYPQLWNNLTIRLLLYFSGPIVFIIATLNMGWHAGDSEIFLFTGLVFLIIHAIFYRRLLLHRK